MSENVNFINSQLNLPHSTVHKVKWSECFVKPPISMITCEDYKQCPIFSWGQCGMSGVSTSVSVTYKSQLWKIDINNIITLKKNKLKLDHSSCGQVQDSVQIENWSIMIISSNVYVQFWTLHRGVDSKVIALSLQIRPPGWRPQRGVPRHWPVSGVRVAAVRAVPVCLWVQRALPRRHTHTRLLLSVRDLPGQLPEGTQGYEVGLT